SRFAGCADQTRKLALRKRNRILGRTVGAMAESRGQLAQVVQNAILHILKAKQLDFLFQLPLSCPERFRYHAPRTGVAVAERSEHRFGNDVDDTFLQDFGRQAAAIVRDQGLFAKDLTGSDDSKDDLLAIFSAFENLDETRIEEVDRIRRTRLGEQRSEAPRGCISGHGLLVNQ